MNEDLRVERFEGSSWEVAERGTGWERGRGRKEEEVEVSSLVLSFFDLETSFERAFIREMERPLTILERSERSRSCYIDDPLCEKVVRWEGEEPRELDRNVVLELVHFGGHLGLSREQKEIPWGGEKRMRRGGCWRLGWWWMEGRRKVSFVERVVRWVLFFFGSTVSNGIYISSRR